MLTNDFKLHPRKRVNATPKTDWAGRPMPKKLSECYGSYSNDKQRAYNYCVDLCKKYDGFNFCITGYNTFTFTVSFDFMHPETGEYMRAIITRDYNNAYYVA